jgi:endonuclease/exonuclease/phosphatase family metal-dependent hydrolase
VTAPPAGSALRVLTWNVRHLRDDAGAVASLLSALDPDVVCLQEAPVLLRWRQRLARLARESGLLYLTGGRTAGDCALLAHLRADVLATRDVLLPRRPRLHRRGVALALVRRGGIPVVVGSLHLGLDADERVEHAQLALAAADTLAAGAPVVLAGDLNEPPGGPAWRVLGSRLRDAGAGAAVTYPATRPRVRIDTVHVDPRLGVHGCDVPPQPPAAPAYLVASDHLPVLAHLVVPGASARGQGRE